MPPCVFDLETSVLDHLESSIDRSLSGLVMSQSELEPHDPCAHFDRLLDDARDGLGPAEDVDDIRHLGKVREGWADPEARRPA